MEVFQQGCCLQNSSNGRNPRQHGSGHTGGLNSYRGGGVIALILVALGDITKGVVAVLIASQLSDHLLAVPIGGISAIAGHNWPVWLKFKGGMGLATGAGITGSQYIFIPFMGMLIWVIWYLVLRHQPRATLLSVVTAGIIIWFLPVVLGTKLLVTGACMVIGYRYRIDWNRKYD